MAQEADINNQELEKNLRIPPQNLEAEQSLLSALLVNNKAYEKVSEFLKPEHFASSVHGKIYEACARLIERGQLADPLILRDYFKQDGSLDEIGGFQYLMNLANASVSIINAADYGRLIHDRYIRREIIDIGTNMVNEAYVDDLQTSSSEHIESAEKRLYELSNESDSKKGFVNFPDALNKALEMTNEAMQRDGGLAGVSTGLTELDKKLGGLHDSDLLIMAGRPGMGKTAISTNVAYNAAEFFLDDAQKTGEKPKSVAFFSLEMSADQLAARVLSSVAQVGSHKMRNGELDAGEFNRLAGAVRQMETIPLFIDDTPGLSVNNIRTRARRLKREKNLGLIIIDYLQLLSGSGTRRSDNRVQEVSEMTRGLKILAKELNLPVICLSQLSRAVEAREDKRPLLSDLRESGSIEQDADVVMFVYREFYYLDREEPVKRPSENDEKYQARMEEWEVRREAKRNIGEVVIAKQRHGPTGNVELYFNGEFTQFSDLAKDEYMPEQY
jgi:replicative DNA helicase